MSVMPSTDPRVDLEKLKRDLDIFGYVVVPNLIPREKAGRMSQRLMELMRRDPEHEQKPLQNLHGVFNALETSADFELFVPLLDNPVALALAEYKLGMNFQMSISGALWLKPHAGSAGFGWHADVPMGWFGANKKPRVDLCFAINCLWMLTDFTQANGATRVLPFSHRSQSDPGQLGEADYANAVSAEGTAGSCLIFDNALWHAAGSNTSDQHRLGVSNPYFPIWLDGGNVGWTPVTRKTYAQLPPHVQKMHLHVLDDAASGVSAGMTKRGY